jgi:hypothetical protein
VATLACVQHAVSNTGRQFPLFVVVGHPAAWQLAGTPVRAVSEYLCSTTLPAHKKCRNQPCLLHFWMFPSSTTKTPAVLENSRNFRQKSAFLASFLWMGFRWRQRLRRKGVNKKGVQLNAPTTDKSAFKLIATCTWFC